jgi:hypothetical protein
LFSNKNLKDAMETPPSLEYSNEISRPSKIESVLKNINVSIIENTQKKIETDFKNETRSFLKINQRPFPMRDLAVEPTGGCFYLTVIHVPSKKREKHQEPSYYILKINRNDFVKKFENEQI